MPLAWTSKWRHGPSMRVSDGSGADTYQPEGSAGGVSGLLSGPLISRGYTEAPAGGSVILSSVLAKLGTYGIIRFDLNLFPHATRTLAPALMPTRRPSSRAKRVFIS